MKHTQHGGEFIWGIDSVWCFNSIRNVATADEMELSWLGSCDELLGPVGVKWRIGVLFATSEMIIQLNGRLQVNRGNERPLKIVAGFGQCKCKYVAASSADWGNVNGEITRIVINNRGRVATNRNQYLMFRRVHILVEVAIEVLDTKPVSRGCIAFHPSQYRVEHEIGVALEYGGAIASHGLHTGDNVRSNRMGQ